MKIQYENLTLRQAGLPDVKQLAAWWNDGTVMAHAGFPNGVGVTEEEVAKGLGNGCMVIEENDRLIGNAATAILRMALQKLALKSAKPIVKTVASAEKF